MYKYLLFLHGLQPAGSNVFFPIVGFGEAWRTVVALAHVGSYEHVMQSTRGVRRMVACA